MELLATQPVPERIDIPAPEETSGQASAGVFSDDEFQKRVDVVMEAIKDEEKMRRCLAEIHTYLSLFEQGFREMQQDMLLNGGPFALMRRMFGKGGDK